ncbi:hypothetical protein SDC9_136120 [bioreactor metagenome]|uniref:Uncharacterized protein n=1 Tax=bioreactor metagenome TaxID=1076179 RepID=A0A645DKB6_9ZZZZ
MCLLSSLTFGGELTGFGILFAVQFCNRLFCSTNCHFGEVYGVGTHISDETGFVEVLCRAHGLAQRKTQFAGCLLLQGGGCEGGRRSPLALFLFYRCNIELCPFAFFQYVQSLLFVVKAMGYLGLHQSRIIGTCGMEHALYLELRFGGKLLNLPLPLHYEPEGNGLDPACREFWLDFFPQYR